MVTGILIVLAVLVLVQLVYLVPAQHEYKEKPTPQKAGMGFIIGFISDFFDTLGIGSFLISTILFRLTKYSKDARYLPGTLLTMHAIPTLVEAFFFIAVVKVEALTLISMVVAATLGAFLGSKWIVKWDKTRILTVMGVALLLTSIMMMGSQLGLVSALQTNANAMGLHGWKLIVAVIGNFIFGGIMAGGVGLYAPCMVMVSLLGLKPIAAFPIMMVSCAALMPTSSITFIKNREYERKGMYYMILGGALGALVAATIVKNLPMGVLSWIIIVVGIFTSITLFQSAIRERKEMTNANH